MSNVDFIAIQATDEFNYTACANFLDKKSGYSYGILALPGFEIMFFNFDKIFVYPVKYNKNVLLSDVVSEKHKLQANLLEYAQKITNVCSIDTKEHVYKLTFSNLAKEMLLSKQELYKPKKADYEAVKKELQHIDQKIITINGRNLSGERSSRNDSLYNVIKYLIDRNYYVINCTIPNMQFQFENNYSEISSEKLMDYSVNISYFLNSNCLISVANAGGITNHICTKSNVIMYGNPKSKDLWASNKAFGYESKSLLDVSSAIKPTFHLDNLSHIESILSGLDKPRDVAFFDEDKIIYMDI